MYEKMQKEHDRTKARLVTYDRKSKAADEELAILHEEKFVLQDRVTTLEKELEQARQQRNDVQDLHNREGAQWRQIISLSNQLQKQHTEQAERWKEEKGELVEKIELLEEKLFKMSIERVAGGREAAVVKQGKRTTAILPATTSQEAPSFLVKSSECACRRSRQECGFVKSRRTMLI